MDEEYLPYNVVIEQRDGTCDHVDTMRRLKKEKGTLTLLHKSPWIGRQVKRRKIKKIIKNKRRKRVKA